MAVVKSSAKRTEELVTPNRAKEDCKDEINSRRQLDSRLPTLAASVGVLKAALEQISIVCAEGTQCSGTVFPV